MNNEAGKVRQSAVLMNYGPGAIIDFRVPTSGAAISVVSAGLEQWERQLAENGGSSQDIKRFTERRLCDKLGVTHFRMPPVAPDDDADDFPVVPLVGARFPGWLQCPRCDTIRPARKWGSDAGDPSRYCDRCSAELPDREFAYVVPVRFVTACRNGHLEDFPWSEWVHHGTDSCSNRKKFKLQSVGPGLAGIVLTCPRCSVRRTMEHVFKADAHSGRQCGGGRPWLANADENCDLRPATMQRGASNLYFPRFESALVIPPWSEEIIRRLGYRWSDIESIVSREQREAYVDSVWDKLKEEVGSISKDSFKRFVEEKVEESALARTGNLRWDEYRQFMLVEDAPGGRGNEFEVRVETPPASIPHMSHLHRVMSLREIRALHGFSRIEALPGSPPVRSQFLSAAPTGWLPAIDVRGEGIFLALDQERLESWESQPAVLERAALLNTYAESSVIDPDAEREEIPASLGARYLLLHGLSHILMKQLSLQCGYSSASLRELIYVGDGDRNMAGILIYTATSDSDGTLGGLQREGLPSRFSESFLEAIRANEWCASDPLCINGLVSSSEASSLASCHSCLLAPETSCQDFNRFLDRAMLVGTPEDRSIGFFADLLTQPED